MKKLLALVLALVMTLSLCVTSNAAFTDAKNVDADFEEAVAVLSGMGVFKGYEDGSFKPEGSITRAEVAAIVYRLYTGDVKDKQAGLYAGYGKFDDMQYAQWAAGYVGFCANAGFVKGYGNGKFGPSDQVTGYQALAMILRAVGYGQNGEFEGADWELHVAQVAQQVGALKNVKDTSLKAAASRQLVAELLFQVAAYVDTVTYTPAFGYVSDKFTADGKDLENETLGKKNFDLFELKNTKDDWGRPSHKWIEDKNDNEKKDSSETVYAVIADKAVASFNVATSYCDICEELGESKKAEIELVYTNGVKAEKYNGVDELKATATSAKMGAQGQLVEVYEGMGKDEDQYRFVIIDTYVAVVADSHAEKLDKNGHVEKGAYLELDLDLDGFSDKIFGGEDLDKSIYLLKGNDYEEEEYVLVAINEESDNDVEIVGIAGKQPLVEVVEAVEPETMSLDGFDISLSKLVKAIEDAMEELEDLEEGEELDVDFIDVLQLVSKLITEVKLDGEWVKTAKNFYIGALVDVIRSVMTSSTKNFGKVEVIFDQYDNVIALLPVETDETVVVIDKLYTETEKGESVLKADLVGTDGETETYTIDEISDGDFFDFDALDVDNFSDKASRNETMHPELYDTLFYYVEDTDETYDLVWADADSWDGDEYMPYRDVEIDVDTKDRDIYGEYWWEDYDTSDGDASGYYDWWAAYTDDTKFLIHENDGSYTAVTGDEVGNIKAQYAEVLYDADGYADVVYLFGFIWRESDKSLVYVPVQDMINKIEKQEIDGDYYTCVEVDVIPAEGGKAESAYLCIDPEFYGPTTGLGEMLGFDPTRIGGFFANVVYAKDTKVLSLATLYDGDDLLDGELCYFVDVVNAKNTAVVATRYSYDGYTDLFLDWLLEDFDASIYYDAVNTGKVNVYVIEDGEIEKGTAADLKEGKFGFIFWDEDEYTDLYIDFDLSEELEDFKAENDDKIAAFEEAEDAKVEAMIAYDEADSAVDAAELALGEETDTTAGTAYGDVAVAKKAVADAQTAVDVAETDVTAKTAAVENAAPGGVEAAKTALNAAKATLREKQADLAAAEAALGAEDDEASTEEDASAYAKLNAAKAALETAEAALEAADAALDAASEAHDEALEAVFDQRGSLWLNPWLISFAL